MNSNTPTPTSSVSEEVRSTLKERAEKALQGNSEIRKKYPLSENSEPCFTYHPEAKQVTKR